MRFAPSFDWCDESDRSTRVVLLNFGLCAWIRSRLVSSAFTDRDECSFLRSDVRADDARAERTRRRALDEHSRDLLSHGIRACLLLGCEFGPQSGRLTGNLPA
jgi:hypothetical protein